MACIGSELFLLPKVQFGRVIAKVSDALRPQRGHLTSTARSDGSIAVCAPAWKGSADRRNLAIGAHRRSGGRGARLG
jgi:hypothetical protein